MSHRNRKFRLQDISDAIQKIDRYVEGMRFEEFLKDEKTADAVIRQLTIIGEAASHIPEEISSLVPDIPPGAQFEEYEILLFTSISV